MLNLVEFYRTLDDDDLEELNTAVGELKLLPKLLSILRYGAQTIMQGQSVANEEIVPVICDFRMEPIIYRVPLTYYSSVGVRLQHCFLFLPMYWSSHSDNYRFLLCHVIFIGSKYPK